VGCALPALDSGKRRTIRPVVCEEVSRIGKEAIHNAMRHSQAKGITVTLSHARTVLELRVEVDGAGMQAAMLSGGGALGHSGGCVNAQSESAATWSLSALSGRMQSGSPHFFQGSVPG
jgi:signal transduction histidine kinase